MAELSSTFWEKERQKNALALFHRAARQVPAYKDFLKKHHISPLKIKTLDDFQSVPVVDKNNYLRRYPLEKLVWPDALHLPLVWTATSGSTGEPFYFPRNESLDIQYSSTVKSFLDNSSYGSGSTLVIIGFGMGVWIGGLITYKAYEIAARAHNYPVSILTPGINKKEIFHALRQLSPNFSQTILVGYPPFVKDILDSGREEKIDFNKINLRLHFAAEAFTEQFRDYLAKAGHIKDVCRDTMNIYGSADIGAMAFETPLSILTRRTAMEQKSHRLFSALFGNILRTPTLAQYDSRHITFEAPNGEILLTGNNALPLIRYAIGDRGGTKSFEDIETAYEASDLKSATVARENGLTGSVQKMPFVYIYERADFSTKLYGATIFPEHIRAGLAHRQVQPLATGKFTMMTKSKKNHDQYLEIVVELKNGVKSSKRTMKIIQNRLLESLLKNNNNYGSMPRKVTPVVVLKKYEDPAYFKPGIKQKWVLKTP
jgi:phenylacetate-coenzyme A ligase PaaK-like adenylate-forming protein